MVCHLLSVGAAALGGPLPLDPFLAASLAELRGKIQSHDYVYLSDLLGRSGERAALKVLREFDRAGGGGTHQPGGGGPD